MGSERKGAVVSWTLPVESHFDRLNDHPSGENLRHRPCPVDKAFVRGRHRRGALKRIFRATARPRTLRAKMKSQDPALRERFRRALANSAQYNRITQRNQTTAQTPIITPAEMPPPQALRPNVMINLPPVRVIKEQGRVTIEPNYG